MILALLWALGGGDTTVNFTVFPNEVRLDGALDFQRIVVVANSYDDSAMDWTDRAQVVIEDETIVSYADGFLRPVSDGQTSVRVRARGQRVMIPVTVTGATTTPDVSFGLDVVPVFTAAGCNAGIDIKEMQGVDGFEHLLGSGEACYAAFRAIYETPVPVIAAVNDFCMGLGVGLAGSADIIIASTKARFGLPELDNGALGCSSHLARLVPPLKLRQMTFTCMPVTAQQLFEYGTVFKVVEPDALRDEARALAVQISDKPPAAVRFAKAALNHIDPSNLHTNYRLEQGYTYQLNIMGIGDQQRDAFVTKEREVTR